MCKVTTLKHKIWNHAVNFGTLITQVLPSELGLALVALGEGYKILHSLWAKLSKEAHHDTSNMNAIHFDVKKDTFRYNWKGTEQTQGS